MAPAHAWQHIDSVRVAAASIPSLRARGAPLWGMVVVCHMQHNMLARSHVRVCVFMRGVSGHVSRRMGSRHIAFHLHHLMLQI